MVCAWVGKELPDRRQKERRIKVIRAEEGESLLGRLPDGQGETVVKVGSWCVFVVRVQGRGRGLAAHLPIG